MTIITCNPLQQNKSSAESDWLSEQGRAHAAFHSMSENIHSATISGKRLNPIVRGYLRNNQVRLSAALRALGGHPDRDTAIALRNQVNAWSSSYAPIRWYYKKKPNGTARPICILPPDLKAVHYMLAMAIQRQFERNPTMYGVKGFSRDTAAGHLKELQSAGYVYLAKTDIVNCYQSIDPDALYQLPLGKEVIRRTLDPRYLTFMREPNRDIAETIIGPSFSPHGIAHKASGPTGLLQGSPASGIILAWLLNGIPAGDDVKVILCFDNIIIAARTASKRREMVDTLASHFERCPYGPLALCDPEYADNTPMEFLGYLFDPIRTDIGIAEKGLMKVEQRLVQAEQADEAMLLKLMEKHQQRVRTSSVYTSDNPFAGQFPLEIWHIQREFRCGYPLAQSDGEELSYYLETSAQTADMRHDPLISHLHRNLFAPRGTTDGEMICQILKTRKQQKRG
jgi:hypothetical protein